MKLRLAPRSGTGEGEAFTGGDDSRLLVADLSTMLFFIALLN
ncbi:MAG: hypothetical protein PHX36_05115 [Mesotoga sp.]|nr:hypothetical protein [Mesotoga sp.]MDI9366745.1 hypothetical protein [Thermotogota bacterium]